MRYKVYEEKETVHVVECYDCYDTGFMFIKVTPDAPETLCACKCVEGEEVFEKKIKETMMPRYGEFLQKLGVVKVKFPFLSFKPNFTDDLSVNVAIQEKVDWWKEFKNTQIMYWENQAGKDMMAYRGEDK